MRLRVPGFKFQVPSFQSSSFRLKIAGFELQDKSEFKLEAEILEP